jgi:hypothetical protein
VQRFCGSSAAIRIDCTAIAKLLRRDCVAIEYDRKLSHFTVCRTLSHRIAPHCIASHCTALHCIAIALSSHRIASYRIASHRIASLHTAYITSHCILIPLFVKLNRIALPHHIASHRYDYDSQQHPTPYNTPNAHHATHPTPHTLHSTPYTPQPTTHNLHPTQHPTPHTLHNTLHPTPYTTQPKHTRTLSVGFGSFAPAPNWRILCDVVRKFDLGSRRPAAKEVDTSCTCVK